MLPEASAFTVCSVARGSSVRMRKTLGISGPVGETWAPGAPQAVARDWGDPASILRDGDPRQHLDCPVVTILIVMSFWHDYR